MGTIANTTGSGLLAINYDEAGAAWAEICDNVVLGWVVDDTGPGSLPVPVIAGTLPPAVSTGAVVSPQWAQVDSDAVFVPDLWRGTFADFLTWLATNNEAKRKVNCRLANAHLANIWQRWQREYPGLVYTQDA